MSSSSVRIHQSLSKHYDNRPQDATIDTIVLHCMYIPGSPSPYDMERCIKALKQHQVSAHYLISRRGRIVQLVHDQYRAWHAGKSKMPFKNDRRSNVNHFSIGIELLGRPDGKFTASQYHSLALLTASLCSRYPISAIVGHDQIAPGRKVDPGSAMDWKLLRALLSRPLRQLSRNRRQMDLTIGVD